MASIIWRRQRALFFDNGLTIFFASLVVVVAIIEPAFLEWSNIQSILRGAAVIGIIASGMTVVMVAGGFDLSVARVAALGAFVRPPPELPVPELAQLRRREDRRHHLGAESRRVRVVHAHDALELAQRTLRLVRTRRRNAQPADALAVKRERLGERVRDEAAGPASPRSARTTSPSASMPSAKP